MTWLIYVVALIILVIFSAFFSGSEISYASASRMRLTRSLNETGSKRAKRALFIYDNYDSVLGSILIGNNLVNLSSSTLSTQLFILLLAETGLVNENVAAVISTACITVFVLIFGETAPKIIAKNDPERFGMLVSAPLRFFYMLFYPVVWVVMKIVGLFSRHWDKIEEDTVTEDDLSEIIDTVEDEGVIDEDTSDLLQSALDFPDICAYEVITPRVDMVAIDIDDDETEIRNIIEFSPYSRIPVYEDTIDNIIGVIHLNKFLGVMSEGGDIDIRSNLMPVCFVHKTTILPQVLREMRQKKIHIAIVTDEYGGTMGLITMEDILECLVGEIWDETDEIENEITKISDTVYEIDGDMRVYDFLDEFEIDDKNFDDDNATVGGWAIEQLGGYPAKGDTFDFEHLTITVKQLKNLRITRLSVLVNEKPEPEEEEIDWEGKED